MTAPAVTATKKSLDHKPRPLVDLLVSIVIPSILLIRLSNDDALGATTALVVALAFPISRGLFELLEYKKLNFVALLGLISVLLTGGIGLLQLNTQWLAVKEAAIPGLIGITILASTKTRYPLIKTLLNNPRVLNVDKIGQNLVKHGHTEMFGDRLLNATYLLGGGLFSYRP